VERFDGKPDESGRTAEVWGMYHCF
jgi:hypothetical protein